MKLKHRRKQERKHRTGEIPVGSFSDIAFLLIIYFLVATTLVKVKSITADLPSGQTNAQAQVDETPVVNLRGPDIFFKEKQVSLDDLNARLAAMNLPSKQPDERVIMLESTDETPYDTYFQALAAISSNGGVVALVEEEE